MTARTIDGKALAETLRQSFKARVNADRQGASPRFGRDFGWGRPASEVYVRNKVNGCLADWACIRKDYHDAAVDEIV